jgi:hypothetical protein
VPCSDSVRSHFARFTLGIHVVLCVKILYVVISFHPHSKISCWQDYERRKRQQICISAPSIPDKATSSSLIGSKALLPTMKPQSFSRPVRRDLSARGIRHLTCEFPIASVTCGSLTVCERWHMGPMCGVFLPIMVAFNFTSTSNLIFAIVPVSIAHLSSHMHRSVDTRADQFIAWCLGYYWSILFVGYCFVELHRNERHLILGRFRSRSYYYHYYYLFIYLLY